MKYTIQELADAKGTSEPVRQALLAMQEKINELTAEIEGWRADQRENMRIAVELHNENQRLRAASKSAGQLQDIPLDSPDWVDSQLGEL